jgi:DNA-3-methyladenine glycosylase I
VTTKTRCWWATDASPALTAYHDHEWGTPLHDEHRLFELLILEGAQAGLSWSTILNKREAYRKAYRGFDPAKVAKFGAASRAALAANAGIVRNVAKIGWSIRNAQAFLALQRERGSFDTYLWSFVDEAPLVNLPKTSAEVPASTPLSDRLSADLRKRGFGFVGTTICYAFLQGTGVVDDHLATCFRARKSKSPRRTSR